MNDKDIKVLQRNFTSKDGELKIYNYNKLIEKIRQKEREKEKDEDEIAKIATEMTMRESCMGGGRNTAKKDFWSGGKRGFYTT